jgi:PleD family two-component response regulator
MTTAFYEEGSNLLTARAFEFVLENELRRAVRSQNFLTLVTVEASREWEGLMVTADEGAVHEVAQLIGKEVRNTDLIGRADRGMVALVLLDADYDHSTRVIDRFVARLENYKFQTPLRVSLGAACYPTHALSVDALKRQAMTRPVVNVATRSSAEDN